MTLSHSPAPLTGFIFDLDGVLIDSNPLHIEAWRRALQAHGHHVAPEKIFPEIGKGGTSWWFRFWAKTSKTSKETRCVPRTRESIPRSWPRVDWWRSRAGPT